jgi:hypothetical protein
MMMPTRDCMALRLHLAVEALITAPSIDSYNTLSTLLITLTNAGVRGDCLDTANRTIQAICARFERVGKVGVSGDEAAALRGNVGGIDAALALLPANKLATADAVTELHGKELGLW